MSDRLLLDTDVIIDYLRGHPAAVSYLETLSNGPATASIVVAELYAGVREGAERHRLEQLLAVTPVYPLSLTSAVQGGLYRRQYLKSHNVGLADALIAATASEHNVRLVTLNARHFPMLSDVIVPYIKP